MTVYFGAMSGTSLDGVDIVAVDFYEEKPRVIGIESEELPKKLRNELLDLCSPGFDEINRSQKAANELSELYALVANNLMSKLKLAPKDVRAIGAHGQTIRHNPQFGATTQLINGSLLAELTEVDVITDFRHRDMAAGGEGAPLVPAFHYSVFSSPEPRAIVNIGGISNVTYIGGAGKSEETFGFDCGPGNMLMDAWIMKHFGERYDKDGRWAASGKINQVLLTELFEKEPYFRRVPPKSTGRELFNLDWLESKSIQKVPKADVQRTLLELTVCSIKKSILDFCPSVKEIFVCGGGALNPLLMQTLKNAFRDIKVGSTDMLGIETQSVEGAAFAWLAKQFIEHRPGNLPAVTGAKGFRVLGCLYPA